VTDADPVSWLLVAPGWRVVSSDGAYVGDVEEVLGDTSADIFNGLSVRTTALTTPRYVAAEQVAALAEGEVRLSLTAAEVEAQPEFTEPPPTVRVSPADALDAGTPLSVPSAGGPGVNWWRRLLDRLGGRP
jgi:hypothetical protein